MSCEGTGQRGCRVVPISIGCSRCQAARHAGCPVSLATRQQGTVVAAKVCSAPSNSCDSPLYRLHCKAPLQAAGGAAAAACAGGGQLAVPAGCEAPAVRMLLAATLTGLVVGGDLRTGSRP